jgi:hypothetical protein
MSILNSSAGYRRDHPTRVPVVLPLVQVTVTEDDRLMVTLDQQPHETGPITRSDVGRVVGEIATELGSPVRVELRELDGSVFTDIVTPPSFDPAAPVDPAAPLVPVSPGSANGADAPVALTSRFGIAGSGFAPGEDVAVAVVVAHQIAAQDGTAHLRLPPALFADQPLLVLLGRTSGSVAMSGPTRHGAA